MKKSERERHEQAGDDRAVKRGDDHIDDLRRRSDAADPASVSDNEIIERDIKSKWSDLWYSEANATDINTAGIWRIKKEKHR